jgi:guanosine-3',5'-bis(diphosphate) 3'-pyrophosphohydrolase
LNPPDDAEEILKEMIKTLERRSPRVDLERVSDAYRFAAEAHGLQKRKSGELFVSHPVETVKILCDLLEARLDTNLVLAALLHDVAEDTPRTLEEIGKRYGLYVAFLVDGVTKISGLRFDRPERAQAENFRKMLLSMAKDMRVILIKLADRLHNMRSIDALAGDRARRIARETKDVYAPLAHRLGIAKMKWELEDLSFKVLNPKMYDQIKKKVALKRGEREQLIEEAKKPLLERLHRLGIRAEVTGRPKHFDSIYRKMQEENLDFSDIYDLLGLRVITEDKNDCYRVLGVIHDTYTPVHDKFKDYIAVPKTNMYQSLHTTVVSPQGKMVEFQIRTREMHKTAELGIAAHYSYKEGGVPDRELMQKLDGLVPDTTEWEGEADPAEFMEFLKISLYQDEVFVFTPKGDLRRLPKGSTPLDLAYAIHTEVGHHCTGAKVNGRIVPLRHELKSGETVEIITSHSAHPGSDWIGVVRTSSARAKVRRWLKDRRRADSIPLGKEMLDRELKRERLKPGEADLIDCAQSLGMGDIEDLYAALGDGTISVRHVITKISPHGEKEPAEAGVTAEARRRRAGVKIQGMKNLMIHFARCCQPVPGERITGLVTRGRGLSVHASDCPNALNDKIPPERRLEVEWDVGGDDSFVVGLRVYGEDRQSLLADIAQAISVTGTNIRGVDMGAEQRTAAGFFLVEVRNLRHLDEVRKAIKRVKGVTAVERDRPSEMAKED